MAETKNGPRVAIVSGLRTPFQKQGTGFAKLSALDLAIAVSSELVARTLGDSAAIEQVVFGQVLPSIEAPNIARELVLGAGFDRTIDAFSVSRACATSYQSVVSAAQAIRCGAARVVLAGGADSSSVVPITVSKPLAAALLRASKERTLGARIAAFRGLSPRDFLPVPPAIQEFSTGLTMGQSAEKMAQENGISRVEQDEFAHRSHTLAARAWADGRMGEHVMTVLTGRTFEAVAKDNLVRTDSDVASYAKLRPAFARENGSVTAGNSSPLTDGAAALLLMSESRAKELGLPPLGYLRSSAFAALDPKGQLLMGPAYAAPKALDSAGLKLKDLDLIDMHEAFSAQVLSNTRAFESADFAKKELGRGAPLGKLDWDKFNVMGGSLAIGHPFAATGARQILQTLHELRRRRGEFALCTACAAGGLGAAIVLEAA